MPVKKNDILILYPKDVALITRRNIRTAQVLLQKVRKANGKQKYQFITIDEFCSYYGISEERVLRLLCS